MSFILNQHLRDMGQNLSYDIKNTHANIIRTLWESNYWTYSPDRSSERWSTWHSYPFSPLHRNSSIISRPWRRLHGGTIWRSTKLWHKSPRRNFVTPTPPPPPPLSTTTTNLSLNPDSLNQTRTGREKFELSLPTASPHPVPPTDTNHLPPTSNPHPRSYADSVRYFQRIDPRNWNGW